MAKLSQVGKFQIRFDTLRAARTTPVEINARQQRRLEDLLDFTSRESRFYKRLYGDIQFPITNLEDLPITSKPMLMEHFEDIVTDTAVTRNEIDAFVEDENAIGKRFLGRYPVWTTSGTTGEPGIFLQDDYALTAAGVASTRWLRSLLNVETAKKLARNELRAAMISIDGHHYAAASGVTMLQRRYPFLRNRFKVFSPKRSLPELVADLNDYQPALITGYASVIKELAREQTKGRLMLSPAFISTGAEPISVSEKRELSRIFDCPVREIYGSTEFFALGVECEHGNLHANSDWVILEPVDEEYQPVEPGKPSATVLLTNLANRIQPLVRYDLGDSITMYEEPCSCGSPFPIIEIGGRQGEILHFSTDDGRTIPVFPLPLSSTVEQVQGIHRTQIIQTDPRSLTIRLDTTDDADERVVWEQVESALHEFLERLEITGINIKKSSTPPQRESTSGKYNHVWSEV
ncbi:MULTISPECIES: phenylacetate--CoA ligase family protein [unclassified Haladaptatus]|uniref:phenylacetate--CoA ligase family protein n=1 Tax=unclassified Haladaptatus TaxID=2622732 RepID=UPI00209C16FA|nr:MULTISPECIES: phenylacetate--CoA ligase family protein [unclassified Haladaptatus]MCO8246327.1 phenylacetate--CoA ligase family protein [Haladaptatus sp. AB643]MCO8255230.1 phenylacetate--CoA ligase family protein [Haladaptatus sp. AB618]